MSDERTIRSPFAASVVRLAGLWILAGALFKLFLGTPNDLPDVVRRVPIELGLTYRLVIAIELCVASLALLRPKWAWPVLVAMFLLFEGILATQIAAGASSCGCFGSNIPMSPWLMLVIDSVLLLAIVVARPWAMSGAGLRPILLPAAFVVGIALPWMLDRQVTKPEDLASGKTKGAYATLDLAKMIDRPIEETEVGRWFEGDVRDLPPEGRWILWRWNCEHCATHLEKLAKEPPSDPFLVLVRLKDKKDSDANRKVFTLPSGPNVIEAAMRDDVEYVGITTPGELMVADGKVVSAREGEALVPHDHASGDGNPHGK